VIGCLLYTLFSQRLEPPTKKAEQMLDKPQILKCAFVCVNEYILLSVLLVYITKHPTCLSFFHSGEYKANAMCLGNHCVPCQVRFPSCRGLPDGPNHWVGKTLSSYIVNCQNERVVSTGLCDNSQGTQVFDPATRKCVQQE
jgi:hypothetical protein